MAFTSKFVYIINAHRLNIFNKNDKYVSSLYQKKYINLQSYNIIKLWFHNIILKCNLLTTIRGTLIALFPFKYKQKIKIVSLVQNY